MDKSASAINKSILKQGGTLPIIKPRPHVVFAVPKSPDVKVMAEGDETEQAHPLESIANKPSVLKITGLSTEQSSKAPSNNVVIITEDYDVPTSVPGRPKPKLNRQISRSSEDLISLSQRSVFDKTYLGTGMSKLADMRRSCENLVIEDNSVEDTDSFPQEETRGKPEESSAMSLARPKSPKPPLQKNDESIWDKFSTLGRKKKIKEVQEVQEEGKSAIDTPGAPVAPVLPPEEYNLEENEERSMAELKSLDDPKVRQLIVVLIDWINDELASQRIIVKDIVEDLYDGQVLQKLFENLSGHKLDVPEVTQSAEGQQRKLRVVLEKANQFLGVNRNNISRWSVESVHSKNVVSILNLLVALVRHYRAPIRLPENVSVSVVVVQKQDGMLKSRIIKEEITQMYNDYGQRGERDAFDTLFDHAPDKLKIVKRSLETFVNKQLAKINLDVTNLDEQFSDGVNLILLMGLLEGYFVPLYEFHLTPRTNEQKIHNVAFAFELMNEAGLPKPKARPEDIVNLDLKSTLRVLYNLFTKYKHLS